MITDKILEFSDIEIFCQYIPFNHIHCSGMMQIELFSIDTLHDACASCNRVFSEVIDDSLLNAELFLGLRPETFDR